MEILKKNSTCRYESYRYISISKEVTSIYKFKLGKTQKALTRSNGFTQNKTHFEGNKIISVQEGKRKIYSVREFSSTHMIMTMACNGITTKRIYRAIGHDDSIFDVKRCCVIVNRSDKNNLMY